MRRIADYVGSTTKSFAGDIRHVVEYETDPTIDLPLDPANAATATETRIWEKEIDLYMRRKGYLTENKKVLYSLLLGQCTEGMKGRLC